jgi:hypothetical protein
MVQNTLSQSFASKAYRITRRMIDDLLSFQNNCTIQLIQECYRTARDRVEFWATLRTQYNPLLLDTCTYTCFYDFYASHFSDKQLLQGLTGVVSKHPLDNDIIEILKSHGIVLTDQFKKWSFKKRGVEECLSDDWAI